MKKPLTLLLALVMCLTLLAGCGGTAAQPSGAPSQEVGTSPSPTARPL